MSLSRGDGARNERSAREKTVARALWHADFEWRRDHLIVRQTGARVPLNWAITQEFLSWWVFYVALQPVRFWRTLFRKPIKISFSPAPPRPWYLLWAVTRAAGGKFVAPDRAELLMYFEDATIGKPSARFEKSNVRRLNFNCVDVSKSHVAQTFERIFGYALSVDPRRHDGPAVEKSEDNGAHDGAIVMCPCDPKPGRVYQRLIDTEAEDGLVEDLRCPTVAGRIPVVFIKRRPVSTRFANANAQVILKRAEDVLTSDEQAKLASFSRAMNLDWGGLDVLRDRHDGRIYVVDVNKTDMGPPTALSLGDKLRATLRLAAAFREAFDTGSGDQGEYRV